MLTSFVSVYVPGTTGLNGELTKEKQQEYERARWILEYTYPEIYAAWTAQGSPTATDQTGKKRYNIRQNIGKAKYIVNFHDGVKTHNDGSEFFDIKIFSNKKKLAAFIRDLTRQGYTEQ